MRALVVDGDPKKTAELAKTDWPLGPLCKAVRPSLTSPIQALWFGPKPPSTKAESAAQDCDLALRAAARQNGRWFWRWEPCTLGP